VRAANLGADLTNPPLWQVSYFPAGNPPGRRDVSCRLDSPCAQERRQ
jgi:hypothetical protein